MKLFLKLKKYSVQFLNLISKGGFDFIWAAFTQEVLVTSSVTATVKLYADIRCGIRTLVARYCAYLLP